MLNTVFRIIIFVLLLVTVVVLSPVFFSLLTMSLFHGAYFAGTGDERLNNILKLAQVKPGQKTIDLGSGDGRVVIALAQAGARAVGVELNPWLVFKSRRLIKQASLDHQAAILRQDMWSCDLSPYNLVTVYGIGYIMADLEKKLKTELKPGSKVISVYFKFPNLKPKKTLGEVYLYQL
jgi:hypothetical protein